MLGAYTEQNTVRNVLAQARYFGMISSTSEELHQMVYRETEVKKVVSALDYGSEGHGFEYSFA